MKDMGLFNNCQQVPTSLETVLSSDKISYHMITQSLETLILGV